MLFPRTLERLTRRLENLPGVGPKSAQRLALFLLRRPVEEIQEFAEELLTMRSTVGFCTLCGFLAEGPVCEICQSPGRRRDQICVVADVRDVVALERAGEYHGLYHVLHGLISPQDGVNPEKLRLNELIARASDGEVSEVIIATSPTVEGDTTALYAARMLKPTGVKVSRIAYGMPVGGDLDYADAATIASALEWRREM